MCWLCKWFDYEKTKDTNKHFINLIIAILITGIIGIIVNDYFLPEPIMNFMLMGMAYSTVIANMLNQDELTTLVKKFNPILLVSMILVILNLGAPLDYHLIFSAGMFTVIYILTRAFGKYFGARFGATVTKCPETVKNI